MEFEFAGCCIAWLLFGLGPSEGWRQWLMSPANVVAVMAPLCGTGAAIFWAARIHRHALRTVCELRKQVGTLQADKEASESANAAKDEFLVKLSHEIRTPMNGIIAFAELASRSELTMDQRQQLSSVLYSAEWLTQVIGDVLDFTRMRSADVRLEQREFSVNEMAFSAVKILEPKALAKNLAISLRVEDQVPEICIGDPGRLRQILVNLLDNAVRFTTAGGVMLVVKLEETTASDYLLSFAVADTGIGIPAERQSTIFEPFQASSRADSAKVAGAGLGLSICRHLTGLMGGTIQVQSQIGAGSTFQFTARLQTAAVSKITNGAKKTRAAAKRLSILLAEADATSRRMNTKFLESAGHQVTPASRAQEAVDKFSTDLFDLVLLDGEISDLDVVRPCQKLREFESDLTRTPVYMFLASEMKPNPEADGYIRKPLDSDELMALVNRVASPELTNSSRGR